jgi:hypothetical protein
VKLPELSQPHGQVPLGGFGIASCAPCDGVQNEPEVTRPEPEPKKPEPKRDTNADRQAQWDEWNQWADSKIENAIQAERAFVLECVGQAVGQMVDDERQAYKRALQSEAQGLKTELAELKALLVEYRAFFATGDRSVLDLPNPLAAKRVN